MKNTPLCILTIRYVKYSTVYMNAYVLQVGAGFSFTDSQEGYSTNQDQIADNLYEYEFCLYLTYN